MPSKMLIDASHSEETRVVVVRGNRIEEFDFESQDKKQLKGNIYLARVTRVEPSLQAAFVEYGGNRHGFLAFSEIHPDYYQIPVADRQALLRAEAEAHDDDDDDDESEERNGRSRRRRRNGRHRGRASDGLQAESATSEDGAAETAISDADADAEAAATEGNDDAISADSGEDSEPLAPHALAEAVAADVVSEDPQPDTAAEAQTDDNANGDDDANGNDDENGNGNDGEVESVGAEDALEEIHERRRPLRRQYKIQEVIKRRQILLVQVVKEERGNKGAALTTYLSLAGRYSVLMPNTARGGGISRKITNAQDRKRLKDVVRELEVPEGMGVILRTAGESRTKAEIKRDYEYLMRLWDNVRSLTLQSSAPALVYEEGSLIKRSVRDLYNKDISEILIAGEEGYREAKDFMRMLMPSHAKVVQPYRETVPIFARYGIESQFDKMLQPQVTLKSGGYLILNQTEALVAIDVNSGRSTREHSIEDTALQTNLEAAEEIARQLRLRDLAGLIVIDFIDMEENRNNRAVEKRLKDHLKNDRARIQVGRISHFGLLEMSRQRIRASVLESTTQPCPHCGGAGHIRSESSVALLVIRAIEEFLLKDPRYNISVRTPASTAIYVLNHKRATLLELESRFGLSITIEADDTVRAQHYAIVKGTPVEHPVTVTPPVMPAYDEEDELVDDVAAEEDEETQAASNGSEDEGEENQRKRRRRRRRRGGRDRDQDAGTAATQEASDGDQHEATEDEDEESEATETADAQTESEPRKRRRGKRGGRRNRREEPSEATQPDAASAEEPVNDATVQAAIEETDTAGKEASVPEAAQAKAAQAEAKQPQEEPQPAADEQPQVVADEPAATESEAPKKRPARRRATKTPAPAEPEVAEAAADLAAEPAAKEETPPAPKPRRAPRRKPAAAPAETVTEAEPAPVEAEQKPAAEASTKAEPAGAETSATPEPEAAEQPEPADPVVTSSGTQPENDDRPRKAGWWQRRGFF